MTKNDITKDQKYQQIRSLIGDFLEIDPSFITPTMNLQKDLGFDSLEEIGFFIDVEKHFQIKIDDKAAEKIKTVSDLHAKVQNLLYTKNSIFL